MGLEEGRLIIRYSSGSQLLANAMPIEIRDRHHSLVEVIHGAESWVMLRPGLYSVTAILEDGRSDTRLVDIAHGRTDSIEFAVPADELYQEQLISEGRVLQPLVEGSIDRDAAAIDDSRWLFAASRGLEFTRNSDGVVDVLHYAEADAVSWIAVRRGDELSWLALPISGHSAEGRRCTLRFTAGRAAPTIELPRGRRVTNALHGMVDTGKLGAALALADHSVALLASKYQDPIGAAYGGLMLERFGGLARRTSWINNLARDFAWLPDGRILLAAALAMHDPARAVDVLLDATRSPFTVFSEALSLALSLLRRWSGDDDRCAARHGELAPTVTRCDFDSPYTTLRMPLEGK